MVNNSYYDADNSARIGNSLVTCGFHGPDQSVADSRWPSDHAGCYSPLDAEKQSSVISKITAAGNIASINYSAEKLESCSNNSTNFMSLKNSNIAVVAAVGNRGSSTSIWYPACNQHVISVGALNLDLTLASSTSLQGTKIDFFADGIGANSGSSVPQTSYAAPVVAGAFAVLQSARTETLSIDQMKYALEVSSPSCVPTPFGCRPKVTTDSIQDAAECINYGTCLLGEPEPEFPYLDYNDGSFYGSIHGDSSSNYEFDIDFSDFAAASLVSLAGNLTASASTITVPNERDVVLSFDAQMASNSSNGFRVYINNTLRESTGLFVNENSFSFTFKRSFFSSGNNTIRIEPTISSRLWGLSNIKAAFTPIVELMVNQVDTNEYGSDQDPERPTGMRAFFELDAVDEDVIFAVTGWKISDATEIAVYLNGLEQGFLTPDINNLGDNDGSVFTFDKADLVDGINVIEFVQKVASGASSATSQWGVSSMLLVQGGLDASTLTLGTADPIQYGNNYGTGLNLLDLNATFTPLAQHDHKISWNVFDVERSFDVEVFLNNTLIKGVETTVNNTLGSTESITLAWRLLKTGPNVLSFRVKTDAFDDTWGVTNILVKTSTVVDLDDLTNLEQDFGYFTKYTGAIPVGWTRTYSTQEYQTRLYATFDSTATADKIITITGWDIDSSQELSIFLNGAFLQYVSSIGSSSKYSPIDTLTIPKETLVVGVNTLSFRAEDSLSGFQSEKWGVFFGEARQVNLVPIIMYLLDE